MKKLIYVWTSKYHRDGSPCHVKHSHWTEFLGGNGVLTNITGLQAELDNTFGVDRWFMWQPALFNGKQITQQ